MENTNKLFLIILAFILSGCSVLDVYRNADEPVDWAGKESWGFLSVKNNGGRVLISPRPRDSEFKAQLSSINYNARSRILLEPGINDINVYAMNGAENSVFTMENIKIKEKGIYQLVYNFEANSIKTKIVEIQKEKK